MEQKVTDLIAQAREKGIAEISTCNMNGYGWDKQAHLDMVFLSHNCPEDLIIEYDIRFGVHDWTIIHKTTKQL